MRASATPTTRLERAQGCLMGQLAGDALGSMVEFRSAAAIRAQYPGGLRDIAGSPIFHTLPGQPTDDSEMALALARTLVRSGTFDGPAVLEAYKVWVESDPFDLGTTIGPALCYGSMDPGSESNGALMRVSPLGSFGSRLEPDLVAAWAREDSAMTHANPACHDANALFAMAIAKAVREQTDPQGLYAQVLAWAQDMKAHPHVLDAIHKAGEAAPEDYMTQKGWVCLALHNALWQLLNAPSLEEGVIATVACGGDTDTTAAICGTLMGAVHGLRAVPTRWVDAILSCRPEAGLPGVRQPRPASYWPVDALELAAALLGPDGVA